MSARYCRCCRKFSSAQALRMKYILRMYLQSPRRTFRAAGPGLRRYGDSRFLSCRNRVRTSPCPLPGTEHCMRILIHQHSISLSGAASGGSRRSTRIRPLLPVIRFFILKIPASKYANCFSKSCYNSVSTISYNSFLITAVQRRIPGSFCIRQSSRVCRQPY